MSETTEETVGEDPPLVALKGVGRTFEQGRITALRGVDLEIRTGDFLAVTGPSGCGKSTLLGVMGALDDVDEGEILFAGKRLGSRSAQASFRSRTVGFVFQSFHLLPTLTALENVQIPMFEMPWNSRERATRAAALLEEVGLSDRSDHLPSKLSGGERQRVAIARSLANEPGLVLADEPTGNLDSASARRVMALLCRIQSERETAMVVVTHDKDVAAHAREILPMRDGEIARRRSVREEPEAQV